VPAGRAFTLLDSLDAWRGAYSSPSALFAIVLSPVLYHAADWVSIHRAADAATSLRQQGTSFSFMDAIFRPVGRKNDPQDRQSTMLPQAKAL